MSNKFLSYMPHILKHEGGYSDHPSDPGGATNKGITLNTLKSYRKTEVTKDDVKALSLDEVYAIYKSLYWDPINCDELPVGIDFLVFDMGVNSGIKTSVKLLQDVVGVKKDGVIGPDTLNAVNKLNQYQLVKDFTDRRQLYYESLTKLFKVFGKGWTNRNKQSQAIAINLLNSYQPKHKYTETLIGIIIHYVINVIKNIYRSYNR